MGFGTGRAARGFGAVATATALATAGLVLGTVTAARAAPACEVTYTVNQWGTGAGGFLAMLDIRNSEPVAPGWTLNFAFPGSQKITSGFLAQWSQSGSNVTAKSNAWGPSGTSFTIGFNGAWTGSNPPPTAFTLNGVSCKVTLVPSPSPSPSPTPTPAAPLRIVISPTSITVREGRSASVQVTLNRQPPGDVTVGTARVYGDTDLSQSSSITFTPANWNRPQLITVTAAEDADVENGTATFDSRSSQITGSSAVLWQATEWDNEMPTPTPAPPAN
ncbi:cellulose binding domain-containing protein [Sphaerisporangium rhizosphaerae]|uniref:Cellulose binding domain-containing protein n=1 Tax=Sphaerisporangium rhizosphaerae TaxID=2269375 RepID=A0ABW2PH66_9ACTN